MILIYNKLYKYIWIYISIRIINDYIFFETFPKQIRPNIFNLNNYPSNILVPIFFIYLGSFIFSILLYFYSKEKLKVEKKDEQSIKSDSLKRYELIHYIYEPNIKLRTIIFTSFLSIMSIELTRILYIIGFMSLFYFSFDLFFVAYINLIIFDKPIYSHKKCAILFILIFSTIFKFISNYEYVSNDKYNLFYKNHIILIPIFMIIYILLTLIRFYSLCKIKWIFDYKFIPVRIFFIIYNFLGIIIILIPCLISSNVKCADKTKINDINLICLIKIDNDYYFDSFSYYFKQLWRNDRNIGMNILYLFLFLIQLLLNALRLLYSLLIIRNLSPEYYLCSYGIYFFISRFFELINAIINDVVINTAIFNLLADTVSLICILIYLELIELNFCNLNHNLKKNIENRCIDDYNVNNLYDDNDKDSNNI